MKELAGKVGIVTGASRGIGAAIAKLLVEQGAKLVLNYNKSAEQVYALREELVGSGNDVVCVQADVSSATDAARLSEVALEAYGKVDFLVNNAGINQDFTLRKMEPEHWQKVIDVNLNSVYNCSKAVIANLIAQKSGAIINISSIIGQKGGFGQANYAAAKAGIIGFTKSAALELAKYGVTINAICPGFIETQMIESIPQEIKDTLKAKIPLRRFGLPEEVAKAVRYLLIDGQYITGQCLNVNGGLYM